MGPLTIIGIAIGLAMDAFAVSVATSVTLPHLTRRHIFRFAFHFGLFQALMPILGWLSGRSVVRWVAAWDHWVAFGLLGAVGGKAIVDALRAGDGDQQPSDVDRGSRAGDPTRGWSLVTLSVATSIDAFAVGLSLGCLEASIWIPVLTIGLITAALSSLGMLIGRRLGARFGRRTSIAGGLILIGIGVKILCDHLAA